MKLPIETRPAFVTKDSGERQTFASGMQRDTGAKELRPDLLPLPMLVRWAELMGRGAIKYGERNWEQANSESELARFKASAFRHFVQWLRGDEDEDHAAAVFFNIAGAEYVKEQLAEGRPDLLDLVSERYSAPLIDCPPDSSTDPLGEHNARTAVASSSEYREDGSEALDAAADSIVPAWEPDPFKSGAV